MDKPNCHQNNTYQAMLRCSQCLKWDGTHAVLAILCYAVPEMILAKRILFMCPLIDTEPAGSLAYMTCERGHVRSLFTSSTGCMDMKRVVLSGGTLLKL